MTRRPHQGTQLRLPRGGNCCDFCSSPLVSKLYPCKNFTWKGRDVFRHSTGRWGACRTCGVLVDSGAWSHLITRVMREVRKRKDAEPESVRLIRSDLVQLYDLVAANLAPSGALVIIQPQYIKTASENLR
jgi:Zn-finger protein